MNETYSKIIPLSRQWCNAADMYCREVITLLRQAINTITEKQDEDLDYLSVAAQKSGLKVSIHNLVKLTAKYLTGYFFGSKC